MSDNKTTRAPLRASVDFTLSIASGGVVVYARRVVRTFDVVPAVSSGEASSKVGFSPPSQTFTEFFTEFASSVFADPGFPQTQHDDDKGAGSRGVWVSEADLSVLTNALMNADDTRPLAGMLYKEGFRDARYAAVGAVHGWYLKLRGDGS